MDDENNITYISNNSDVNESSNATKSIFDEEVNLMLYKYFVPPMLIFCLLSVIINVRVLVAMRWVRRPISPTLFISLSLAAADGLASACLGIGLLVNSYLPIVFQIIAPCPFALFLEIYRLSSVIITVFHLLALSTNHYLGILKPLHYLSIMTTKKTTLVVLSLWIFPITFLTTYILANTEGNFWYKACTEGSILGTFSFRLVFSMLFIIPLIFMMFCYTHILIIVRKQQKMWTQLSRCGSTRNRGLKTKCQQRSNLEGNVKAIYTTLLILGSCLIGWLPALIYYFLICNGGCLYSVKDVLTAINNQYVLFFIPWLFNLFIILKTLVNPIIYSSRMLEVEEATRKLHLAVRQLLCPSNSTNQDLQQQRYRLQYTASSQGVTAMCRLNGSISRHSIVRTSVPRNTFV